MSAALPDTQNAIVITKAGGPEVLELQSRALPDLKPHEVLIRIKAAGINRHDCNQRKAGPARHPNPIPGLEVSGQIVAAGADVAAGRIGEDVVALTDGGGYAEYVAAPAALALPKPQALNWIEAAALPEALFTAWHNFFNVMRLQPGEHALIHGGTSGVGSLGIKMLRQLGHDVYATCGSAAKCAAAESFGAIKSFNYNDSDLADQIKTASGGGVDAILDMSAGAHLSADIDALRFGGRISHLTPGGDGAFAIPLRNIMAKQISISGSLMRPLPLPKKAVIAKRLLADIWPHIATAVRPVIAQTLPLAQAADGQRAMEKNAHIGKIMLQVAA